MSAQVPREPVVEVRFSGSGRFPPTAGQSACPKVGSQPRGTWVCHHRARTYKKEAE